MGHKNKEQGKKVLGCCNQENFTRTFKEKANEIFARVMTEKHVKRKKIVDKNLFLPSVIIADSDYKQREVVWISMNFITFFFLFSFILSSFKSKYYVKILKDSRVKSTISISIV